MSWQLAGSPDVIARLPAALHGLGCEVVAVRDHAVDRERISWRVLSCTRRRGRAVVAICSHDRMNLGPVICISMDLRRLLRPWHWRADWLLARGIVAGMLREGATIVSES